MDKYGVFSMIADKVIFEGSSPECENYKKQFETYDNPMYIVKLKQQ